VPRLLSDQIEDDQSEIAMGEETAKTKPVAAAMAMPASVVVVVLAGFRADAAPAMIGVCMWVSMEHSFSEWVST
jgi:hypothetical protein